MGKKIYLLVHVTPNPCHLNQSFNPFMKLIPFIPVLMFNKRTDDYIDRGIAFLPYSIVLLCKIQTLYVKGSLLRLLDKANGQNKTTSLSGGWQKVGLISTADSLRLHCTTFFQQHQLLRVN